MIPRPRSTLVAAALCVLAACGSSTSDDATSSSAAPASKDSQQFVASVPSSTFKLGIVTSGSTVWAYLCDEQGRSLALNGSVTGEELKLVDANEGNTPTTLSGKLTKTGFSGTLTLDGRTVDVSASPAVGNQGVHWKTTDDGAVRTVSSWVVAADGFAGSKATVQTTQSAGGEPDITVTEAPEGPPPSGDPQPNGLLACIRATRELFKANKALAENPSTGAAANQDAADRAQKVACARRP